MRRDVDYWLKILHDNVAANGNLPTDSVLFTWPETKQQKDGSFQFPWVSYSDEMYDFWEWLESLGYAHPFDYADWLAAFSEKNPEPIKNLSWVENADQQTLDKFLFCIRRQERFITGLWARCLTNGCLLRLCQRVVELEALEKHS